jgi:serine phosphatase RsbU (regulator of sigma subunit)
LCVTKRNPYEFDRDVITILYAFADMVSVAMENSRLIRESIVKERMEQELLVAQQMQQSLLPQSLPSSPRYDIAARSIPAYEVGGDYYDVQDVGPSKLGMVVGDVSGKGVSAALYMAQLKGMFQTYSAGVSDTGDLLRRLNETLCRSMDRRSFISLLYAMLDTEQGELRFARAGHCPLLCVHDGEARFLQPSGIALGLDAGERFAEALQEERLPLHAGDIVVLYTDGITEARNAEDEQFETERLANVVLSNVSASAGDILDAVLRAVHDFSGRSTADDDMTILVVRWK